MISKEFVQFHGQPAVLLINLAAADAEEADELAQKIHQPQLFLSRRNQFRRLSPLTTKTVSQL